MNQNSLPRFGDLLQSLYTPHEVSEIESEIYEILANRRPKSGNRTDAGPAFDQRDVFLIAYGDHVSNPGEIPLETLEYFLDSRLEGVISGIHILPFYPFSSDDGFSVIDYLAVDSKLGDWSHIRSISTKYRLVFDLVINHCSQQHDWFQRFLKDEPTYRDFFITPDDSWDTSDVVRPRISPLLSSFSTAAGTKKVWTTFSPDQVDLNFSNRAVIIEMIKILLAYVDHGASIIRLDAIAFLWKKQSGSSINLTETHLIIKTLRRILDSVSPGVNLLSETNIPHHENNTYFGNSQPAAKRTDEAQLVYQFALAPLVLHAFLTGNTQYLTDWATRLTPPPTGGYYFNFIASHDGIGLNPVRELLPKPEIEFLISETVARKGQVSLKQNIDGSTTAYELNTTLISALTPPGQTEIEAIGPMLASQAILLSLAGVPAIYFNSLFGIANDQDGMARSGEPRSLNRQKFDLKQIEAELDDPTSSHAKIFQGIQKLLTVRQNNSAFDPNASQQILDLGDSLFSVLRTHPSTAQQALCIVNLSAKVTQSKPLSSAFSDEKWEGVVDQISGKLVTLSEDSGRIAFSPYQVQWWIA